MTKIKFAEKLHAIAASSQFQDFVTTIEAAYSAMEAEAKAGKFHYHLNFPSNKSLTFAEGDRLQEKFLTDEGLSLRFSRCAVEDYVSGVTISW